MIALDALNVAVPVAGTEVFVVDGLGEGAGTMIGSLVEDLRTEGFAVERAYGGRSVKAQWKAADKSGASVTVMVGRDEHERDAVAVKVLATGEQIEVARTGLVAWLMSRKEGEQQS